MIYGNKNIEVFWVVFFSKEFRFIKVIWFLKMDKNKCPKMKIRKKS